MPRRNDRVFPSVVDSRCQFELTEIRPGRQLRIVSFSTLPVDVSARTISQQQPDSVASSPRHVNYQVTSESTAEPNCPDVAIFFLHGVGGSVDVWSSQINFLAGRATATNQHWRIIAMDFIGHGSSCAPNSKTAYTFDELRKDVVELFEVFKCTRNVIVAHSYGLV